MSAEPTEDDVLDAAKEWFSSFVAQAPGGACRLIEGEPIKVLGGGRSGARVVQVSARDGVVVIKRAELPVIIAEARARRARVEGDYASSRERERFQTLRRRGASHVSIHTRDPRFDPQLKKGQESREVLYGVIAYEYVGADAQQNQFVQSLADFVQSDGTGLDDIQVALRAVLETLFKPHHPEDDKAQLDSDELDDHGEPLRRTNTLALMRSKGVELPDKLKKVVEHNWGDQLADGDLAMLQSLSRLWHQRAVDHPQPEFADSRLVHGDPRLANILIDRRHIGDPDIIDFGDGGPGRHVFHDLARLETDILLRGTKVEQDGARRPLEEVAGRAEILFAQELPDLPSDRRLAIAHHWRTARDDTFGQLPSARSLYWLFVLTELLRRLKWHIDGNDDDGVGATAGEIVSAIYILTIDGAYPNVVDSRNARTLSTDRLRLLLLSHNVDTSMWGAGPTKTVAHLLAELRDGDCELVVDLAGLARRVRNVWVDVHATVDGERLHLVERSQVFADGRERMRHLPASLGEKCKVGEDPAQAARRGLAEELGVTTPICLTATPVRENPTAEASYPGLRSIYDTYWFAAELDPAEFRSDGYVEIQDDKRTRFEWERS